MRGVTCKLHFVRGAASILRRSGAVGFWARMSPIGDILRPAPPWPATGLGVQCQPWLTLWAGATSPTRHGRLALPCPATLGRVNTEGVSGCAAVSGGTAGARCLAVAKARSVTARPARGLAVSGEGREWRARVRDWKERGEGREVCYSRCNARGERCRTTGAEMQTARATCIRSRQFAGLPDGQRSR